MSSKAEELGGISTRYTVMGHLGKPGTLFGSLTCRKIIKVLGSSVVLGIITVSKEIRQALELIDSIPLGIYFAMWNNRF